MDVDVVGGMFAQDANRACLVRRVAGADPEQEAAFVQLFLQVGGMVVADLGCGAGAFAPAIIRAKAHYVGVDLSPKLIARGMQHHGAKVRFLVGDATKLRSIPGLGRGKFDAATFLFSIQDINPLEETVKSAAWAVRTGGRLVAVITHPCFRIPR